MDNREIITGGVSLPAGLLDVGAGAENRGAAEGWQTVTPRRKPWGAARTWPLGELGTGRGSCYIVSLPLRIEKRYPKNRCSFFHLDI